jgi:endogenous inhibitor of DNA gyrase (YacG/DUF329 family)
MAKTPFYGKPCQGCGKFFMPARRDAKFCSDACRQAAYRRRADPDVGTIRRERQRQQHIYATKHDKEKHVTCAVCGRELTVNVAHTNLMYCSNSCKQRAYRQRKAAG